ncbi:helix-turn-helix transcriptional regulator [Chryseobacterium sp. Tr-659]|uniref:winged helix-turn-helix transcriptional regulator n=1 Tax=Chryseobacterium sp. Tr-659 TaxID=2608340 RepID=UPI001420A1A0|nr:helix-turn-helix domain-containing protein [Chryseobacterium sp. Tr-659]NIF06695.1 helix-turn-helix transcriptional regulator [Chryseobacterium sp. Tr-659]
MMLFSNTEACPVRNILDRFSDKWTMLVILMLGEYKTMRFGEMIKVSGDISQKMLTQSLRKLEADGLISRTVHPTVPPKVEYQLTDLGLDLLPLLHTIADWAYVHMTQIIKHRKEFKA